MDKTPKFTAKINQILDVLVPHKEKCSQCNIDFSISNIDIDFFKKFQVPSPRMCPSCRRQRRYAFANYTTLFKRVCDVDGHNEKVISSIPEDSKFQVFDFDYYYHGDRDYFIDGVNFNFNKSFFGQFDDLFLKCPQPSLIKDPANVNSEYVSYGTQLKNCYYVFGGMNAEDVMFSVWPMGTKNSLDLLISVNNNLLYEGVYPENCYNSNFVYFSSDCLDCDFIYDCRNCSNCFGCVNLRNKKYCIWNKEYSKEEYFEKLKEHNLGNKTDLEFLKNKFKEFILSLPVRATRNEHSEDVFGNYIINSKKCFISMWAMNSENLSYTDFVISTRDSYDCSISANSEMLYSTSTIGSVSSSVKFSASGRYLIDCEYLMNCRNCKNCFGCIGLENAQFCIFNKQYTEDEYWGLVDSIKVKMLEDKEYGEFFPLSMSPFPYNASLSNIIYNVSKEKVIQLGGWWYDEKINLPEGIKILNISDIDPDVKNITNDILNAGIMSDKGEKPFRITKDELEFYKRKNIAIPNISPYERIIDRFKYVNNFKVFDDKCFNCGLGILSSYATSDGYKPYCDDCYKKEIY